MKVYQKITDLIGGTPLLELANLEAKEALPAKIYGKMEYFNPAGSVKDRIAKGMIDDAEAKGLLKPGSVIIEPTSGNTGIGLASIAAARGYRLIIAMPETMSVERRNLMKAYGAELVLTEGAKGMSGAIAKAKELAEEIPNSFIPSQFTNPANPEVHEKTACWWAFLPVRQSGQPSSWQSVRKTRVRPSLHCCRIPVSVICLPRCSPKRKQSNRNLSHEEQSSSVSSWLFCLHFPAEYGILKYK